MAEDPSTTRRVLGNNALSLAFAAFFVASLLGQGWAGWAQFNDQQQLEGLGKISLAEYLTSADFAVDVAENWQSEYLQFLVFIVLAMWLVQKGSTESKTPGEEGLETDEEQKLGDHTEPDSPAWAQAGGWRTWTLSWSLTLVMTSIFLASWATQWVAGWAAYNETRLQNMSDPVALFGYLGKADFWSRSLQNWQSEFLAVGSMVIFSVFLRQRGSPQSKPVGEPHATTAAEG
ncbi:MAG: hypothetical protein AVDCRST_MAG48-2547 [uncultured Friedmanniella sp.]|uniref:Transmembrane protein n=1 Tax=uncultured Friedmanniella sp. TaxID=335381 RepID=A0A6J4L0E7_9ACTN|nr:MAG: hypothetical protein AVDCRST_MAG48-2547 [uncultured Friedmanniella sp.]